MMRRTTIPDTIHNLSGRGVPHVGLQPDRREIPSLQSVRTRRSCTTNGMPSSSSDSMGSLEAILRSAVATRPLTILHSSDDRGKSSSSANADALISLKATDTRRPMLSQGSASASLAGTRALAKHLPVVLPNDRSSSSSSLASSKASASSRSADALRRAEHLAIIEGSSSSDAMGSDASWWKTVHRRAPTSHQAEPGRQQLSSMSASSSLLDQSDPAMLSVSVPTASVPAVLSVSTSDS